MTKSDKDSHTSGREEKGELLCCIRHFAIITRVCAIFVIAGLWACVFVMFEEHGKNPLRYDTWQTYLMLEAVAVTLIELICLPLACLCSHLCCGCCWEPIAEGWINSITYAFMVIPNFLIGYNHAPSVVAGLLVAGLAAVYSLKILADSCKCCAKCCPCLVPSGGGSDKSKAHEPTQSSALKKSADKTGSYS